MVLFPSYISFPLIGATTGICYALSQQKAASDASRLKKVFSVAIIVGYGILGTGAGILISCGC